METLLRDIRYGFRSLAKRPGFTAIALIALMLGIGANTAIFSIVNGVLLHPLPYKDPEQLVSIWETQPNQEHSNFSPAEFLDYQAQNQSFSGMAAYRLMNFTLTGAGEPEQVGGLIVSANYFSLLGVEPVQGRALQAEDGVAGAPRVAVISNSYWQNRFASDSNVIGKAITLSGEPVTVVGVMAPNFQDDVYQIWVNPHRVVPDWQLHSEVDLTTLRKTGYLRAFARLKPGVTPAQAQADLNGIAGRCAVDRQKHSQPWTGFMGSAGGVRWLVTWLLPNYFWAFPGGKGIANSKAFIRLGTFVTVNHRSSKAFSFVDLIC